MVSMTDLGGMMLSILSGFHVTSRLVEVMVAGTSRDKGAVSLERCDVVADEQAPSINAAMLNDIAIGRKFIKSNFHNIKNL